MIKRAIIGFPLLVLGIGAIAARRHWLGHIRIVPVEMTVPASVTNFSTGSFRVGIRYDYVPVLIQEHPGPQLDCMAGVNPRGPNCPANTPAFLIRYELYRDGRLVKQADTTPHCSRGSGIECTFTMFRAEPQSTYRIDIHVLNDTAGFMSGSMRLLVGPYMEFYEDWGADYSFIEPPAAVCIAIGALFLGWSLILLRKRLD